MKKLLDFKSQHPKPYFTELELEHWLPGTPDSRHGKVKRLLAQGELIRLRRGLYCWATPQSVLQAAHPFELAQQIYGPSFISLESALNYHQLIPERVYTITSVSAKRSKEFSTPLGDFSYTHTPLEDFYTEVILIKENNNQFLMAKIWRALCDYVFCYKKDWTSLDTLVKNLRIDPEDLPLYTDEEIEILCEYYQSKRIDRFLKNLGAR